MSSQQWMFWFEIETADDIIDFYVRRHRSTKGMDEFEYGEPCDTNEELIELLINYDYTKSVEGISLLQYVSRNDKKYTEKETDEFILNWLKDKNNKPKWEFDT